MSTAQTNAAVRRPAATQVEPLIRVDGVGRRFRVGDNVVVARGARRHAAALLAVASLTLRDRE